MLKRIILVKYNELLQYKAENFDVRRYRWRSPHRLLFVPTRYQVTETGIRRTICSRIAALLYMLKVKYSELRIILRNILGPYAADWMQPSIS